MTVITVRSYHLDGYGHVNNARYLEFLEEARWAFFGQHDLLPKLGNILLVVSRIDIRYLRAATEHQVLHIRTQIPNMTEKAILLRQTITRGDTGKTVAEADVTLKPVNPQTGRTTALPDELIRTLNLLGESL
ncbi:TPA: acyl-CoA thioesterase [Neisseria weaveri]